MSRTVVNITGDSVGTVVVSRSEGVLRDPAPSESA
jgi:Na+/H+-dicarboxylate symporter